MQKALRLVSFSLDCHRNNNVASSFFHNSINNINVLIISLYFGCDLESGLGTLCLIFSFVIYFWRTFIIAVSLISSNSSLLLLNLYCNLLYLSAFFCI